MGTVNNLKQIKGIGPKKLQELKKLNIETIEDLISHYPRRYEDRSRIKLFKELKQGEYEITRGTIKRTEILKPKKGLSIFKAYLEDIYGDLCAAVWFNRTFLKKTIKSGQNILIIGKVRGINEKKEIYVEEYEIGVKDKKISFGQIVPVYPSTEGLKQKFWRDVMSQALNIMKGQIPEVFDPQIRKEYGLITREEAINAIHFPKDMEKQKQGHYRLAFEELFCWQVGINKLRQDKREKPGIVHNGVNTLCYRFIENLSFSLTNAQKNVIKEISVDMESNRAMHRLLQGDVGSGKTVVAVWSILKAVSSGYQAIFMAPTEILARQHYETLKKWFEPLGVTAVLLTGNMKKSVRVEKEKDIIRGQYQVIIGTHVLIQENVIYNNVGFIVIDEQHRFGVKQRKALEDKAHNPDVLIMSATPIPRTLAITIYGELDISILDELPPGRKIIETICIKTSTRPKLYKFLQQKINNGAKAYVVCPLIDESDSFGVDIKNVTKLAQELENALKPIKVGLLHGRMSVFEKDRVINEFISGDINIMVSTTVIEVGIDVPQATIMVIENAERFGLSQLHQLRGRVGRGIEQSYCVLVTPSKNIEALERLKLMTLVNDGFRLAEEDMKSRGPGELLGIRQHGSLKFKIADLTIDGDILLNARNLALKILKKGI